MIFQIPFRSLRRNLRRRAALCTTPAILETLESRRLLTTPGMIEGVIAYQSGPPSLGVSWNPDDDAVSYEVKLSGDPIRFEFTGTALGNEYELDMYSFNQQSLTNNSYNIQVRGVGSEGEFGEWSETINYIFEGLPPDPGPPVFSENTLGLEDQYFEETPESLIRWNWNGTTPIYDVWINKEGPTGPTIYHREATQQSSFEADEPFEDGIYKFWARARHPERLDNYISEWVGPITTVIGSAQPELTGPTSNDSVRPEITWDGGTADVPFELWVNQEGGSSKVIYEAGLASNSYTPGVDLADGTYSAWVRQTPATSGPLPWSSRYRFVVGGAGIPGTPQLGVTGQLGDLTFAWDAAQNADRYDLWVTNTTVGSRLYGNESVTGLQYTETEITESSHLYRGWLRAFNSDGVVGNWSSALTFYFDSAGQVVIA